MEKASAVSGKTWFSSLSVNGFCGSNVFDCYISRHKQDIHKQVDYSYIYHSKMLSPAISWQEEKTFGTVLSYLISNSFYRVVLYPRLETHREHDGRGLHEPLKTGQYLWGETTHTRRFKYLHREDKVLRSW